MRTFVIGDIHGAYRALKQVLEHCGIDRKKDRLIVLGDVCDGWTETYECVEELLTIENRIDLLGNHDEWFVRWLNGAPHPDHWIQGGYATAESYMRHAECEQAMSGSRHYGYMTTLLPADIPFAHRVFFTGMHLYHVQDNRAFVHAGFNRDYTLEDNEQSCPYVLYWDRDLWKQARSAGKTGKLKTAEDFAEIFIGHTTCENIDAMRPVFAGGVWNLDTGGGWSGKLTIMEVETKEYWQSDVVTTLYPEVSGRQ